MWMTEPRGEWREAPTLAVAESASLTVLPIGLAGLGMVLRTRRA
jgi:hypothetical protein